MFSQDQPTQSERRVHALRSDGYYYPGTIESRNGNDYAIAFDDGHCYDVVENHIVGTGFRSWTDNSLPRLKHGQKVVCLVGDREWVEADVLEHDATQNSVMVSLGDGTELLVPPRQLRLAANAERRRSSLDDGYTSASPDLSFSGVSPRLDKRLEEARRAKTEREAESILDECTVALVLTSLSSSPTSWDSSSRQGLGRPPDSPVWRSKRHPPPASPLATGHAHAGKAWPTQDGSRASPCPSWASRSTATPPPGIGEQENDSSAPVSPALFTTRAYSPSSCPGSPNVRFSYYPTTVPAEASADAVLALASMKQADNRSSYHKSHPISIPHTSFRVHPYAEERSFTPPRADMPPLYKVLDLDPGRVQTGGVPRGSPARPRQPHGASPVRKFRSDGRKCRKVYGMENKHLWCTQCRWKKACVRFID
ncbi:uncharacterized protein [Oscarella lobularis]|uniref:uncharacterized protein n=1 Tax=Oscarella lobularis TaxID=121494 RepID=UPI0033136A8F